MVFFFIFYLGWCALDVAIYLLLIKVVFLPKNTTSVLKLCDLAIIKCMKGRYRLLMVKKLIAKLEMNKNEENIAILDGIHMIGSAWN